MFLEQSTGCLKQAPGSSAFQRMHSEKLPHGHPAFPKQAAYLVQIFPHWQGSRPCHPPLLAPGLEFPKERGVLKQQCPLSGSDQGFIVRKSPFPGPSLSASSNRPSPSPIPCQPTISRLYGNEKLLFFTKKRLGEIKWLTLILFRNPSELPSLNTHLACGKGNLFQKHWTELTNSLCM